MDASSALGEAAAAGDLGAMRRVLDGGADPNVLVPAKAADGEKYETTALVAAAGHGQLEAAALLLDRGASPDKPSSVGFTPLMAAAYIGHAAMVGLLLERGADSKAADPEGNTAFHFACLFCDLPGCVEALVRAGCDTTAKTNSGLTGKQMAEHHGCTDVLERLRDLVKERLGEASRRQYCLLSFPPLLLH